MPATARGHGKRFTQVSTVWLLAFFLPMVLLLPGPHNATPAHAGSNAQIAHYEVLSSLAVESNVKPGVNGKASVSTATIVSFEAYGRTIVLELVKNDRLVAKLRSKLPLREEQITIYKGSMRSVPGSWARMSIDKQDIAGVIWDGTELLLIEQLGRLEGLQIAAVDKHRVVIVRLADITLPIDANMYPTTSVSAASMMKESAAQARTMLASGALTSRAISLGVVIDTRLANSISLVEQAAISWANFADGIFTEQVGIHLDLEELINLNGMPDPFNGTNANALLSTMATFKSSNPRLAPLGLAHLLTRIDLDGDTRGIALLSSACGPSKGVGLTEARGSLVDALIRTHEIAHHLGAPHDNESGSACSSTPDGFLMSPTLNGSVTFSACSIGRMSAFLNTASCIVPVALSDIELETPILPAQVYYKGSFPLKLSVHNAGVESVLDSQFGISGNGGFDVNSMSVSNRDCFHYIAGDEASCGLDNLYPGETVTVQTEISPKVTGLQTLDVFVNASNDTDPSNNVASIAVDVIPATELFVDGFNLTSINTFEGGSVTYNLTAANLGDLSTTAIVQLRTEPEFTLGSTANCTSPGAGQLDCDVGTVAGGGIANLEYTVHVPDDLGLALSEYRIVYIDATLLTSLHDTARFPGRQFLFGVWGAFYDVEVGFSEPPVTLKQGETRELVAYVTNFGPDPVPDLNLGIYVEAGVEFGAPVTDRDSCTLVGQLVSCRFGQFDVGEFVSVRVPYTGVDARAYQMALFPELNGGIETSNVFPNAYVNFNVTSTMPPSPPPPPPPPPPAKSGGGGESWLSLLALLGALCRRAMSGKSLELAFRLH
jgi:hypothetical protein